MKLDWRLYSARSAGEPLELWGGVECTVNRVGNGYRDQLHRTGHDRREGDLALLAGLGLSAVRYPVLWERVAPEAPGEHDWGWSDRRLDQLRDLGIRPIVGLVHHGSGPHYTSLIDDAFAPKLAAYAKAVARRYPWIADWTPINEPLTTARFSCLYGLWYPHLRDEPSFWTALLNQIDAVRLAMRAIREVTPKARLIQTEDLGLTYATPPLAEQAGYNNARRWMTWDLLAGRVVPGHDLWDHLHSLGLAPRLHAIADDPCSPDIIGINHYLTSDRFLDHRIERYPRHLRGSNASHGYADVEAIRVLDPPPQGLRGAIVEASARYRLPVALTEIHNGCSRDEQLRWLYDAWRTAQDARNRGADVCAVTSWALFGSSGWDTLLTGEGRAEAGAFDVRSGIPRATALAGLLGGLADDAALHPAAGQVGWWRRDLRLQYGAARKPAPLNQFGVRDRPSGGPPILITGASGTLGRAFAAACRHRGLDYVLTDRTALDLLDEVSIASALERHRPWAVVNCAGWVRVDDAEAEGRREACMAVNAQGAAELARACQDRGIRTASFSSDLVFGGTKDSPYLEQDEVDPLCVYGRSKARMEEAVLALSGEHLVIRTAAFFSPFDEANFAIHLTQAISRGRRFGAVENEVVTPTYVPDLCDAALDLLIDGERGIWHLTNEEAVSWFDFGRRLAEAMSLDASMMDPMSGRDMPGRAPRPLASALESERGVLLPSLQSAIDRFAAELKMGLLQPA